MKAVSSLCNLCVLCVSVVDEFQANTHHRVTEELTRDGAEKASLTDQQGRYAFKSMKAGIYTLRVTAKGFAVYESADLQVSVGQRSVQDIQLRIGPVTETVTVPSESPVGTEPENNADSPVLHGKQLDVLPDDSDDLASALQALAGPAAGPNGGEVFVDGFSGARLPPKSSIREVRVNQNQFSAEFDGIGFGRIEILTRPGTNEFAGEALFNFNDESLNARDPYTLIRAPYQVRVTRLTKSALHNAKRAHDFVQLHQHFLNLIFEFDTNTTAFSLTNSATRPVTTHLPCEEFLR